jgi:hypothetical protein
MTIKARYEFTIKGEENQQLKIEAKSYAEAFRQFWNHFMTTDLIKTIETVDLANIRTSESEFFVAVNGQKKKNIMLTPSTWIYTHLTPKAMEKAYEKFMKGWNGEITAPADEVTAMPETNDDLSVEQAHAEIDQEIEMLAVQGPQEAEPVTEPEAEIVEPEAEPEAEVKKLSPSEERKAKTAAILAAQREEKRKKEEAKKARKLAKQQAQQQQESQEELELPEI